MVAIVHLLQVKLEFVFICDSYVGANKRALIVIKALLKGGEMFVTIPLGIVCVFQCFLCLDIEGHQWSFRCSKIWKGVTLQYTVRQCFSWE
jgi:hypothetical protein